MRHVENARNINVVQDMHLQKSYYIVPFPQTGLSIPLCVKSKTKERKKIILWRTQLSFSLQNREDAYTIQTSMAISGSSALVKKERWKSPFSIDMFKCSPSVFTALFSLSPQGEKGLASNCQGRKWERGLPQSRGSPGPGESTV